LFCNACQVEYDLDTSKTEDFKIVKKIRHDEKEYAPIIMRKGLKNERISSQDRKAFEDYFSSSI